MTWLFRARRARSLRSSPLAVELLEGRAVPATLGAPAFTANAFGGGSFNPFAGFAGQVNTASGDVNGDGVADIITAQGAGAGSGSRVRIFDGAAAQSAGQALVISDFYAYADVAGPAQTPGFAGGVFVAAGDLNGDGRAEVVTSTGAGANGHVKVFDFSGGPAGFLGNDPALRASFFAYPGFLGEVRVAVVNQSGGQLPLLVTASGAGTTQSDVRLFNNATAIGQVAGGTLLSPFAQSLPFPGFTGGVSIAGGDSGQLIVSRNTGTSQITAFDLTTGLTGSALSPGVTFQPATGSLTDIRLGTADVNGDGLPDVLTSFPGSTANSGISAFSLAGGTSTPLTSANGFSGLTGFQGFGMFGGTWLSAGSFADTLTAGGSLGGTAGAGSQGLQSPGSSQGPTGGSAFTSGSPVLSPGVR